MKACWSGSRRSFALLLASAVVARRTGRLFAQNAPPARAPNSKFRSRRYVVHAEVMLGMVPIFVRKRVGGALLTIEESGSGESRSVGLQFGAGSWPERVRGFNRFGMTRELVRLEHGAIARTEYLSFITACPEANLSQARQAFKQSKDLLPVTVAYGQSTVAGSLDGIRHQALATDFSWVDCADAAQALREQIEPIAGTRRTGATLLPTFLYAMRQLLLEGSAHASTTYVHNAEVYRLVTEMRRDDSGSAVVAARTSRQGASAASEFKLWLRPGSETDLPNRIEFRAKSYLKLTLEVDETPCRPVFPRLIEESQS
jgi:hypothetical protein